PHPSSTPFPYTTLFRSRAAAVPAYPCPVSTRAPALIREELRLQRVDLALILVALRLHDVADRHHPDQPALIDDRQVADPPLGHRSEEHTSELQSPCNLV